MDKLVKLKGELFKDGYYKAFVLLAGPCQVCKQCAKSKGLPCSFGAKSRPCMEACGIDVYQTARNSGMPIQVARMREGPWDMYGLVLLT